MKLYQPTTVLVTHPQYPESSGLSNCIFQLASSLCKSGYTVFLVTRTPHVYRILSYPDLDLVEEYSDLSDISISIQPDLVVSTAWHTWSHSLHVHFARCSVPCIFWSHGTSISVFYSQHPFLSILRSLRKLHHYIQIFRTLTTGACLVVAYKPNSFFDSRSSDYFISRILSKRVVIVPNPVDTNLWQPSLKAEHRSTLVTQSRLEWQKGFPAVLDILDFPDLQSVTYQWFTSSPSSDSTAYPRFKNNRVQFFHGLTLEDRIQLLSSSLCYISYSQTEYQSLSILEALSCGIPVIATRTGWTKSQSIPGVLLADDILQVHSKVSLLLNDSKLWMTLSIQARSFVERYHSKQAFTQAWTSLISSYIK